MPRQSVALARLWTLIGPGLCLAALLAGCGPANSVDVRFQAYSIVPNHTSVKAGTITFNVKNDAGQVLHQFVVVKTDVPADQLLLGTDGKVDESQLTVLGLVDKLDVGQSGKLTADLAAGHYVLFCNVVGHYRLGMHTDFSATP
jgi:uncharacterized cupredoxin-like copper-binding protein